MEPTTAKVTRGADLDREPTSLFLIRVGEITLKGENRSFFESRLRHNIKRRLSGIACEVSGGDGRFRVVVPRADEAEVRKRLAAVFGITSFSSALRVEKEIDIIMAAAEQLVAALEQPALGGSFKVEARRSDKGFPYRSYDIARLLGERLLERFPALRVDVHSPMWTVNVEIRERAYVYVDRADGPGGLPVGTAGRGMLLLSGGIDSPVAGYLMAKRGLKLDAVYFHAYPYTSDEAKEKVRSLAALLAPYLGGMNLFVVPFTDCQMRIKERGEDEEVTLLMRACMMRIAEMLSNRRGAGCLVTGESLSQVASQTVESLRFTDGISQLPVFRPVIGMDKEEIIRIARRIGTFETSILPFEDCCTIFSPRHPLIHPRVDRMTRSLEALEIEELLRGAANAAEPITFGP
ncbi:MAG TPA: tRNA uracil 4-sulfurtransferase ThiI [Spirochaetia bacterium]|nr:tRNA uracil 4-sulfurtransferase ThiI [Spirochaetia bacterium]